MFKQVIFVAQEYQSTLSSVTGKKKYLRNISEMVETCKIP